LNKQELVRLFAVAIAALSGMFLSASIVLANDVSGLAIGSVPKAICGPGDHTESGLQGQTTPLERSSGDSVRAYNCNLQLVGQYQGEGNYSQDGPAYAGSCAYVATDRVTALQQHLGIMVVDASDPQHPTPTAYLNDTPAAQNPHETLKHNDRRNLLAVSLTNGSNFAVYDTSVDCRHPVLRGSIDLPGNSAHMGNFTPDGLTYYIGQSFEGIGGFVQIVDLADPSNPKQLPAWQYMGDGRPHGIWFNADGTRMYAGQAGMYGNVGNTAFGTGPDGLVIEDVSDYQFRRPNPQIRIISTLFWNDQGTVEEMYPFTSNGRQYVVSSDESGGAGGVGGILLACVRRASAFGYPNIIDITDEANPRIVAKLMLEVNDPNHCKPLVYDPPDVGGATPAYNEERCVTDRPNNSTMLACAFQYAGLRVFDIRDLSNPKEIAYYKPGAMRTAFLPGSSIWTATADRTVDRLAGYPRFFPRVTASGTQMEIWVVSADNGFQILRFSDQFQSANRDLFEEALQTD